MAFAETADLAVRLSLDDRFTTRIGRAQSALGRFSSAVGRSGKGIGQVTSGLARVGTVAATVTAGGLVAVAKAAIDFEDAFAGVRKTVDEADLRAAGLSFEQLARQFRDMATEIPIAATELARIGETAGALGIKAQDIDDFTKTVALLGETTDLTSDAAAEALGKVGTILGLTGQQFTDFADVLVNLGNQGASTESEIIELTKRFAAAGKQAGLSTEQILALASAASSLGIEPEAGGSALSRIFSNMATEIALATDKGKAFARITGTSLAELKQQIDRGEALPILLDTLKGISGLSRTEAASVLKALGITNVRDRDAILKMSQNLGFVNDQLQIAASSTGALGREAQKRFDTGASKLKLLRNGLVEAAITIGEGFTPALGRAAERLSAFLKQDANRAELKRLGEDIGKFIDGIDWDGVIRGGREFVGLLKEAGTAAINILKVLNTLPTEVKALGLGLIGLNKLSGGLIGQGVGNILGGLGEVLAKSLAARIPIFGKAFVQPVFVTNPGFGAGLPGAAGKGGPGVLGTALRVVIPVAAAEVIGQAIVDATGGPTGGGGRAIPNTPGLLIGQSQAAAAHGARIVGQEVARVVAEENKGLTQALADSARQRELADMRDSLRKIETNTARTPQAIEEFRAAQTRVGTSDPFTAIRDAIKAAQGGKADTSILPVVENLARSLSTGNTPWAKSLSVAEHHLANLRALEAAWPAKDAVGKAAITGAVQTLQGHVDSLKASNAAKHDATKAATSAAAGRTVGAIAASQAATVGRINAVAAVLGLVRSATGGIVPALAPKLTSIQGGIGAIPGAIARNRPIVNTYTTVSVNVSARQTSQRVQQSARYGPSHT